MSDADRTLGDAALGDDLNHAPSDRHQDSNHQPASDVRAIERNRLVTRRTITWVFCAILFALFPIFSELAKQAANESLDALTILRKGEQFVVGGGVALGALGEVLAATFSEEDRNFALGLGLGAVMLALGNVIFYHYASSALLGTLIWESLLVGVATLLVSLKCIRMAAGR